MLYSPSPTRIVSTHQSESSPGYSDIHPIEDDPERKFYKELEDRSDDEIEDGCGDECYTPTQSLRESNDSETEDKKEVRGPSVQMNPATRHRILHGGKTEPRRKLSREERVQSKCSWEKIYRISIPEEVWTKELRKFMRRSVATTAW